MRAVLRNLESSTPTTTKKKTSAFYDSEPPYAARVIKAKKYKEENKEKVAVKQ